MFVGISVTIQTIPVWVDFSFPVVVVVGVGASPPVLTIGGFKDNSGGFSSTVLAEYVEGSGTSRLLFEYTVSSDSISKPCSWARKEGCSKFRYRAHVGPLYHPRTEALSASWVGNYAARSKPKLVCPLSPAIGAQLTAKQAPPFSEDVLWGTAIKLPSHTKRLEL